MGWRLRASALLLCLGACSEDNATPDATVRDTGGDTPGAPDANHGDAPGPFGRPYQLRVPDDHDPRRPSPLVVLLHGYSVSGALQDLYFGLGRLASGRGFLLALPDGTPDSARRLHWNAAPTCCNPIAGEPDDVAYLTAVMDDVARRYAVDPRRVFLVGHSNGAFMALQLACERSARIAAVVSLAGAAWAEPGWCAPSAPVAVLQVHGDADTTIPYMGGERLGLRYLGAEETVARWARYNGCGSLEDTGQRLDLDLSLPGAETRVGRHGGCGRGAAELWTIAGGVHLPALAPTWAETIYQWLQVHPRN
ncbi:MAG: hypothetical protein HY909_31645 [Deltaproteobacteria bacterium]|nr:hypothetical protein [Deltaproteobacteria bacterium]